MITMEPIGYVQSDVAQQTDTHWGKVTSRIVVDEALKDGLTGLDAFSHVLVVYYLNEAKFVKERHIVRRPQGREDMPMTGIFAQRSKDRPNTIGITAVKLISVEDNVITVEGLDAIHNTPVLDIKAYLPQFDRREDATVPEWVNTLMAEYF